MAKLSKEEQARREGMSYALRVAREKGIDGLEEELKFRQAYDVTAIIFHLSTDNALIHIFL